MKELLKLAELGKSMREKQEEYGRTHSSISKTSAKKLEREFDNMIKAIIVPIQEVIPPNQISLL